SFFKSRASSSSADQPALPTVDYEVFLSFRGPDVRTTFANCLYSCLVRSQIRTFRDDEELRKGESKIHIPILSQNCPGRIWLRNGGKLSRRQGAVTDEIFSQVNSYLMSKYKLVADQDLVGVDIHIEELLNLESQSVEIVSIHGKTSYDKICAHFDRCCFLEDVRETLQKNEGLANLQNKIRKLLQLFFFFQYRPRSSSFRGPDVRTSFADCLYSCLVRSRIRTFSDEEELRKGEQIAPSLVQAIIESKIHIPIFSQDYASSKWCLQELAKMVECWKQGKGHVILPIFYFVNPRDVRHQDGAYKEAFELHAQKHDADTVKEWREALQEVGKMKGWTVKDSDG
ncbi:Disease resistance protein L6, partial [Linum perenne]